MSRELVNEISNHFYKLSESAKLYAGWGQTFSLTPKEYVQEYEIALMQISDWIITIKSVMNELEELEENE